MRPTLSELQSICQKPQWREVGSLLARRVARPAAVYLTWLTVRWPITANMVTAATLVVGIVAAVLLGVGRVPWFVAGAAVLNFWYLLDHVDGQVARFRRSESVTGVYFDFMMHHIVHAAVAFALGYGLAVETGRVAWTLAGAGFAIGVTALSLANDCRYKAFFAEFVRRKKRLQIENCKLKIANCTRATKQDSSMGGDRAVRSISRLVAPLRWLHRSALKLCEMPNIVIAVTVLAAAVALGGPHGQRSVQLYVLAGALVAPALAVGRLAKQVWVRQPDAEFQDFERTMITGQRIE